MKNAKKILWSVLLLTAIVVGWNFPAFGGSFGAAQGGAGAAQGGSGGGSGGGGGGTDPWTRTGTTIAPTVGTDTITLGGGLAGVLTWKPGLNLAFTTGTILAPTDDFVSIVGSPGNGVIVYGGLAANSSYMEYDDAGNGGGCRVYGGVDSVSGNGAYVRIWPKTGLAGNGLSDGYASLMGVFMPESDGVAALGSTAHGFSSLNLSSSAVASWNGDTGISRDSAHTFDFGNGTAGSKTGLLNFANAVASTSVAISNATTSGWDVGGTATGIQSMGSAFVLAWTSANNNVPADSGISRISSSTLAFGNGTAANTSITVACAGLSVGVTDLTTASQITLPAISGSYSNDNATSAQAWTLPTGAAEGTEIQVIVGAAQFAKLVAPANVVIYLGATPCVRGGFVRSNVPGSTATLKNLNPDVWVAVSVTGTWTEDQ